MKTSIRTFAVAIAALALAATVATAHHSAAQFDFSQRVTIEGIVKEFNVVNPHTAAVVEITDDARGTRDAEYEGHSASHFYRAGYTRGMVKPGDRIAILIAPRNDGEDGGFIQAFTANGQTIGFGGLSPETGRPVEIAQTDDVTLVNMSLLLASGDDKWRLMLSGVNLSDELYPVAGTSSLTTASGYAEIIHARPRSWSFSATRSF